MVTPPARRRSGFSWACAELVRIGDCAIVPQPDAVGHFRQCPCVADSIIFGLITVIPGYARPEHRLEHVIIRRPVDAAWPFSGAAPLALRPLSAIAATAAGGVPEARIKRLLSDLLPSLMSLHAQGEICGDISLDTVGMDEGARAHLLPELVVARSRRNSLPPAPGFAPIELYADTAQWPRGPWTDVWAVRGDALAGHRRPPPAPERRPRTPTSPWPSWACPAQPGVPARHRRGPVHAAGRAAAVAGGSGGQAGHGGLRRCRARVPGAAGASAGLAAGWRRASSRPRSAASRYGSACCWRWSSWVAPLAGSSPAARPMR